MLFPVGFSGEEPTPDERKQHGGAGTVALTIFIAVVVVPFVLNAITALGS